jgi:two-component system OmpR family response regulator
MSGAATIVVAREDFSIPGAADSSIPGDGGPAAFEARFFDLLRDSRPDVVVLDFTHANGSGIQTILRIRQKSTTPILVVCDVDHPSCREYRIAGAAECIPAPVDLLLLNQTLQQIIKVTGYARTRPAREADVVTFAGLAFRPHQNLLTAADGSSVRLTSSEGRLLSYFVANPWVLRRRAEVGEMLYGRHRPTGDRAIDVVVNRLRKKLVSLCGRRGQDLIKTEFRRGYMLVADVATIEPVETPEAASALAEVAG